jgi:hypothetical protein
MAKRAKKTEKSQSDLQDFVIVSLVDDFDRAKDRETLLKNNDIPAVVKQQDEDSTESNGFIVLVPEDCLDEAHVVIESQDAYDDFYDFAVEDEDSDGFDSDLFEDDF